MNPSGELIVGLSLAAQLALIARAKLRREARGSITLTRVFGPARARLLPVWWDAACAAGLLVPATRAGAAASVAVTVVAGVTVAAADHGAGGDCGCFGRAPASTFAWRSWVARLILVGQACLLLAGRGPGWLLASAAMASIGPLVAVQPQLLPFRGRTSAQESGQELLRRLWSGPEMAKWRPFLLDERPVLVIEEGRRVRVVFDAFAADELVAVVADVGPRTVTVATYDPFSLEPRPVR